MRRQLKGKPTDKALLRMNAVKIDQTNSARRLQKDLKELEDSTIPLVGVAARPLSNSLYIWHGNLRGPEGTPFEGGVFHIEITFPQDYPVSPPAIRLFTPITHPNVLGGTSICLDILDIAKKEIYQGWTSAYTVETILIQLQSFLFEELPADMLKIVQAGNKEIVRNANAFRCVHPDCNHQGPIKPYPPFNNKEKDLEQFVMIKTAESLLQEELSCFHTKLRVKDTSLGIGISINRLPRTGEIRMITPTLDLLSMRAFVKQKVRHSLSNEKFTHWLPLYFGEKDIIETSRQVYEPATKEWEKKLISINCKERMIHLLKKSMSYICSGSTRKAFKPSMIMEVMPKLIITHVADLIQEFRHVSILAIRRLVNFIRLFRLLLELYPEVEKEMDDKIEAFIKNPEKRHKDFTGSLGDLLAMVTVSSKFKIEDILSAYLEEQMDRQAFWILKEIPELDHTNPKYKGKEVVVEEARQEVCFKTGIAGFHITLFFYFANKLITETQGKDMNKFCQQLDSHCGCLDFKLEDKFQQKCFEIQKVKSFYKYFPMLGIPMPDEHTLRERLKQSIENSRAKKYHGNEDGFNEVPPIITQALQLLEENVKPFEFYDEAKKEFLDAANPKWKQAVLEKFSWIKSINSNSAPEDVLTPNKFAQMSDDDAMEAKDVTQLKNTQDKLRLHINQANSCEFIQTIQNTTTIEDYPETFTWRDLFFKLCFEQMLTYFPQHQDFKLFYQYIDLFGPYIQTLRVKILDKKNFKSNNYYLMVLIGRMKSLKILKFHKESHTYLGLDGFKYLHKGLKYLQDNGGSIQKLQIYQILGAHDDYLYQCFKTMPELRVLKINNQVLQLKDAQCIGKILSDFKNIQEIDLRNCYLDSSKAKEIADGLMRAKQLSILKIGQNPSIGKGADSILYNLAFSPKINHIDFTGDQLSSAETAEAIYKLVKISGSLETLILTNTNINNYLKEEFFIALGENKTLHYLNLDSTQYMTQNILQWLGKSCAMNKKKNGNLKYLSLFSCIPSYAVFAAFLESFKVSDYSHELWYGDKKVAKDMTKEQLENKFECGLKYLNLNQSLLSGNLFKHKDHIKKLNPNWPSFLRLLSSEQLEVLQMSNSQMHKNDMELLQYALHQNPVALSHIRVLNLARNNIQKEGAKTLALALEGNTSVLTLDLSQCKLGVSGTQAIATALLKNNTLKHLNLYRNKVDVDGARSLRELLKVNKSIEFLDVGHNRLREKGITALTDGICENPDSKIKYLGLRFNFINDDGFNYFFENCIFKGKSKISHIYMLQNYLSEHFTVALAQKIEERGLKIYVDSFEKLQYLNQNRLDRSIWISPVLIHQVQTPEIYWKFFQQDFECGLIKDVRIRKGQKIPGKPRENCYAIIEYAHANSVPRSLRVASKKKSVLAGNKFRIYKAGTRTIVFVRPQKRR
eukprot:403333121